MLHLRRATLHDLSALRSIAERTFRDAFESQNEPTYFENYCATSFSAETVRLELEHPHSEFWLAYEDGQLAAYLKLNFDQTPDALAGNPTMQIQRIYVLSGFQGKKIGVKLMDFAHRRAKAEGSVWAWLDVWEHNPDAKRFYERLGYETFGTMTFWIGDDPQTDWMMSKLICE